MTIIVRSPAGFPQYRPTPERPARFFTPGVGGVGNIKRTGEGDPKYYGGDYTPQELMRLRTSGQATAQGGGGAADVLSSLGAGYSPFFYNGPALDATTRRPTGPSPAYNPAYAQLRGLQQILNRGRGYG